MNKMTALALACAMGVAGSAAFGDLASGVKGNRTFNAGMVANPVKGAVTIDGDLADWDLAGQILTTEIGHENTTSVRTAAMWDTDYLYLSFVWRDNTPLHSQINPAMKAEKGWVDDAVQLRFVVNDTPSWVTLWCYDKNVQAFDLDFFRKPADDKGKHATWWTKPGETALGKSGVEMMSKESADAKGFTIEMKIPWRVISPDKPFVAKAGAQLNMGLDFMWGNAAGDWPIFRISDNFSSWDVQDGFFFANPAGWGTIDLAAKSTANTRTYVADAAPPYGVIPVRAKIPSGKEKFTLVIEDAKTGERLRTVTGGHPVAEAKVGKEGNLDVVEVLWDGLDDLGRAVKPGTYKVKGIAMDHIGLKYKSSFYNPGTPPWETGDGTGGWGADHSRPEFIAAASSNIVFGTKYPEGGYGLWAVGPAGRKVWSEKRGARALTANDTYVYILGGYYNEPEQLLFRLDPATGKYVDWPDGKGGNLPCPYPLSKIRQIGTKRVMNIAADPKDHNLALALEDGTVVMLSAKTLKYERTFPTAVRPTYPLGKEYRVRIFGVLTDVQHTPFAYDGKHFYYFQRHSDIFVAFDKDSNTVKEIPLEGGIGRPEALALSRDLKSIYVTDTGADMQVKKFDLATGKCLATFGKKGGRPRQGRFEKDGMIAMSSVAEDKAGNVWVVEDTEFPRRTGVWNGKDGSLIRDYIGNTFYCGSGTYLHDTDETRAFSGGTEFKIDIDKGVWEPTEILWNPDPTKSGYTFLIEPGMHGIGPIFKSSASGKEREYLFLGQWGSNTREWVLFMKGDAGWRPVTAVSNVGRLLRDNDTDTAIQAPDGEWAGLDARDSFIWNDANGDGYVQRSECEIVPVKDGYLPTTCGWGQRPDCATLEVYMQSVGYPMTWWKYTPTRFTAEGAPVYAKAGISQMPGPHEVWEMPDIAPVTGEDTILRFASENKKPMLIATDKKGNFKWRYRDWWHGVHGSHHSPDGNPNGRLFGSIMLVGYANAGGDCGNVVMIRGNSLHDYWMTTDGYYLDKVFKGVLDGELFPATVEEARQMKFEDMIGHGEPFMGWFGKHSDGKIRSIHGNFALACHICEVSGFDSVVRFTSDDLVYTVADAVKAEAFRREADARKNEKPKPYKFGSWERIEGEGATLHTRLEKKAEALAVSAKVTGDASPWKNGGNDFTKLFKTGDCFDIHIGEKGKAETNQRLVFAHFKDKDVIVQMKPVEPSAAKSDAATYESPVTSLRFECVRILPVEVKVKTSGNEWELSAEIPWKLLGIDAGKALKGDFGMILSDPQGLHNAARIYKYNKQTGLVSDLPNEARLYPECWVDFE